MGAGHRVGQLGAEGHDLLGGQGADPVDVVLKGASLGIRHHDASTAVLEGGGVQDREHPVDVVHAVKASDGEELSAIGLIRPDVEHLQGNGGRVLRSHGPIDGGGSTASRQGRAFVPGDEGAAWRRGDHDAGPVDRSASRSVLSRITTGVRGSAIRRR